MMQKRDGDPGTLAPGTVALLEAWLREAQALRPPAPEMPDVAAQVRYLCGALSGDAARDFEQALIHSAAARRRLRDARSHLDRVQDLSWQEAADRARADGFMAQVAQAWLALASERLGTTARSREWWLSHGWTSIRRQAAQGLAEAQTAWAALLAFGQQRRVGLPAPEAAPARGAGETEAAVIGALPGGVTIQLTEAEIAPEATLRVSIRVRGDDGRPAAVLSGRSVVAALQQDGEIWPLAAAIIDGEKATWEIEGFGSALGLAAGPVASPPLVFVVGPFGRETADDAPRRLIAAVLEAAGQPAPEPAVEIELWGEPRWESQIFRARIALPAPLRARFADYRLELGVALGPDSVQRLGVWPLRDWGGGPRTLTAACPGSADAALPFASALRARLLPPE